VRAAGSSSRNGLESLSGREIRCFTHLTGVSLGIDRLDQRRQFGRAA
jgi:hypothetical protein